MAAKPGDATLHFLAGRFCYEFLSLSWVERKLAKTLFGELPQVSSEEALNYFLQAHQLKPNWKENLLYIAKVLVRDNRKAEAKKYLHQALAIPCDNMLDGNVQKQLEIMLNSI